MIVVIDLKWTIFWGGFQKLFILWLHTRLLLMEGLWWWKALPLQEIIGEYRECSGAVPSVRAQVILNLTLIYLSLHIFRNRQLYLLPKFIWVFALKEWIRILTKTLIIIVISMRWFVINHTYCHKLGGQQIASSLTHIILPSSYNLILMRWFDAAEFHKLKAWRRQI